MRPLIPCLLCLLWLAGCSVGHPLMIDDNTPVPKQLIEPLCVKAAGGKFSSFHWDGNIPTHWDGGASWELDTEGYVIGVECTITAFEAGWPETLTVRGSIYDPVAAPLRTLLQERR